MYMADPIGSLKDVFKGIFSSLTKERGGELYAVGIDIGASSIKAVQMSVVNGRVVLDTYGSIALGPFGANPDGTHGEIGETPSLKEEDIAKAIGELVKECELKIDRVAISVPVSASLFRDITIPNTITDEEMRTVVETEARKVIPVPIGEVTVDWLYVPQALLSPDVIKIEEGKKHLLLVAVSREANKRLELIADKSKLKPLMYELEVFSTMRSIYSHERAPIVIVDFGAFRTKVSIVHEGILAFVSMIPRGANDLTNVLMKDGTSFTDARNKKHTLSVNGISEDEGKIRNEMTALAKEILVIINDYERRAGASVQRVIIAGGGSELRDIVPFLSNSFGLPVVKSEPFARVIVPDIVAGFIKEIEPEFTVAAGLAMRLLKIS